MKQAIFRELHFSFREMQNYLIKANTRKSFWITMMIVIALCTVVGPFSTFDTMSLIQRFPFFVTTIIGSWVFCIGSIALVMGAFNRRIQMPILFMIFGSILGAICVAFWLDVSIRWFVDLPTGASALTQFPYALSICVGSGITAHFAFADNLPKEKINTWGDNALVRRLDLVNRGEPHYLTMQDHYVEVTTGRGRQLLHMRMSDAVDALGEYEGVQIHRSHWVNRKHAQKISKRNGKSFVVMADGTEFPISRTYFQSAKLAGLV